MKNRLKYNAVSSLVLNSPLAAQGCGGRTIAYWNLIGIKVMLRKIKRLRVISYTLIACSYASVSPNVCSFSGHFSFRPPVPPLIVNREHSVSVQIQ